MSQKNGKKKKRTRRGGRKRRRNVLTTPGWHLKLEELRREAQGEPGEFAVKRMRGWELHLRFVADEPEPWSLTAKPASGTPEWGWLSKAADHLGIPELDGDGESQRPSQDDGLHVVMWTWAVPAPAAVLPPAKDGA